MRCTIMVRVLLHSIATQVLLAISASALTSTSYANHNRSAVLDSHANHATVIPVRDSISAHRTNPAYAGRAFTPNTRQFNIPQNTSTHLNRIAGGAAEHFSGKIDASKYGNYGTSMLSPVETFCPGASNARLNGAALDMSWASGTMDAVCRRGVQPFSPARYGQYRA